MNPGDIIIVRLVATTTTTATFANIAGFSTLGIGGPAAAQGAAGTINMANLPASINTLLYVTQAAGSVTVNNGVNNLTVNVNHNTEAGVITTLGMNNASTTSTTDTVTLILGDAVGTVGGIAGGAIDFDGVGPFFGGAINGLAIAGYANVDIDFNGPTTGTNANILSGDSEANVFTANPGALETLTIAGSTELINNAIFVNGVGGTGVITDNDTAATQIFAFGSNAPFSASGPTLLQPMRRSSAAPNRAACGWAGVTRSSTAAPASATSSRAPRQRPTCLPGLWATTRSPAAREVTSSLLMAAVNFQPRGDPRCRHYRPVLRQFRGQ